MFDNQVVTPAGGEVVGRIILDLARIPGAHANLDRVASPQHKWRSLGRLRNNRADFRRDINVLRMVP